ncbi:MAG: VWA domain-containing protein [Phycisphaerales bacterium]|nr:VWA domain-containing protein [Phycisphaerales bacterium]
MNEIISSWLHGGWRFGAPEWLMALWALPVLALLMLVIALRAVRAQRRLGDRELIDSMLGRPRSWNAWLRVLVVVIGVGLITISVARPQSDPEEVIVDTQGRDVVFMLDVSRSMLATDVAPNRLDKAKLWITDLVDQLGGDRVGLVAFAGSSTVACPLTNDRLFFRLALDELNPQSVLVGGTNIGDAIRRTNELVFPEAGDADQGGFRDLVLISDGEDQESLPVEAARQAAARGVRIIAIGIGSDKGALIEADRDNPRSNVVRSRLQSRTLSEIAHASPGGVYLEVGTGTIDLAQVYNDIIGSAEQRTLDTATSYKYTERYPFFLALGLALIATELLIIPARVRRAPA